MGQTQTMGFFYYYFCVNLGIMQYGQFKNIATTLGNAKEFLMKLEFLKQLSNLSRTAHFHRKDKYVPYKVYKICKI